MSEPNRQPIAKVDTAWLRMEQPTNLMMITGIIQLKDYPDFEQLKQVIASRFLAFPRFRHKAVQTARGAWWEEDEDFELTSHIRRIALPGDAGKVELEEFVSELASTPLDKYRPLWQFHYVENYVDGPVVVVRIHHCYADGIALVQVMLSLTDTDREQSTAMVDPRQWKRHRARESNVFKRLLEPAREGLDALQHLGSKLVDEAAGLIRDPGQASAYVDSASEIMSELATMLLLSDDPESRFKGKIGVRKRVAWTDPLPLLEVKAISQALGCTVNDVLIGIMTGALHRYLKDYDEDPSELEIRATIPVNLRPLEHARDLGNHFGTVFLDLPIWESNPLARVYRVAENMHHLKSSKQATVSLGLLATVGMAPAAVQQAALELFARKATTVLTNVPGPRQSLYLAGSEIDQMMFWVPQSGSIGMGISILSYNEQVYCGVITDNKLVPDPQRVVANFAIEFENLLHLVMMLGPATNRSPEDVENQVQAWLEQFAEN
ncbi:MAG: wax ester/triacylglycerol synthase family O-acyltransferase [Wenzhouxiangellaceae bacterium]|nr:wax ester/triacylglycerol synthase family O-acyltransferase [Wenzhouxiangellaceae bacterium]